MLQNLSSTIYGRVVVVVSSSYTPPAELCRILSVKLAFNLHAAYIYEYIRVLRVLGIALMSLIGKHVLILPV